MLSEDEIRAALHRPVHELMHTSIARGRRLRRLRRLLQALPVAAAVVVVGAYLGFDSGTPQRVRTVPAHRPQVGPSGPEAGIGSSTVPGVGGSSPSAASPSHGRVGSGVLPTVTQPTQASRPPLEPLSSLRLAFDRVSGRSATIYTVQGDGSRLVPVSSGSANDSQPAWSPDGRQLAFISDRDHPTANGALPKVTEIYVMQADGTGARRITTTTTGNGWGHPSFSPDGRLVLAAGDLSNGVSEIFVMNPDGSGMRNVSNDSADEDFDAAWSADGRQIVFVRTPASNSNAALWVVNVDGSGAHQLTSPSGRDGHPAWSPDGTRIAFTRTDATGRQHVMEMNADGSGIVKVTPELPTGQTASPAWEPDGRRLAYELDKDGTGSVLGAIHILDLETGNDRVLVQPPGGASDEYPAFARR